MSKVWEVVILSEGDAVTVRVPQYHLTMANIRCKPSGGDGDVIIMLDKMTAKFRMGPKISCGSPQAT